MTVPDSRTHLQEARSNLNPLPPLAVIFCDNFFTRFP